MCRSEEKMDEQEQQHGVQTADSPPPLPPSPGKGMTSREGCKCQHTLLLHTNKDKL